MHISIGYKTLQNCQNIVCEYNRTDIAGETLRKIKPGSGFYFQNSMFHSLPLLHLKGYQPDSFSYRFLKVAIKIKNEPER